MLISSDEHRARVTSSMLWSAWADALGFISELVDDRGVTRRTKGKPLTNTMAWTRRVGGRTGPDVLLPAGTYSDDTQLRLAVARSISGTAFDVEAFARVELTVWQSYALGGGRGTKTAAKNMSKPRAFWAANFFDGWTRTGGNGAAMRIQPHVWASADPERDSYLVDLISDAIVTHGHVRGVLGAVLHGTFLADALVHGKQPDPERWGDLLDKCADALGAIPTRDELSAYWLPRWERDNQQGLVAAWRECLTEIAGQLKGPGVDFLHRSQNTSDPVRLQDAYRDLLHSLDLFRPENQGSGSATTVAAILVAAALPDHPGDAARLAAAATGSDTDTIGTMASALVGASSGVPFKGDLQDRDYLIREAERLSDVAHGRPTTAPVRYPDLIKWESPKAQSDTVGFVGDELVLAGLGAVEPVGETHRVKEFGWTWMRASFGPTFLLKHRIEIGPLAPASLPNMASPVSSEPTARVPASSPEPSAADLPTELQLDIDGEVGQQPERLQPLGADEVPQILEWLEVQSYADGAVGYAVRRVAERGTARQLASLAQAIRKRLH